MRTHLDPVIRPAAFMLFLAAAGGPVMACTCKSGTSPCGEIAVGSAAFTGKVLSVSPAFLNRFSGSARADSGRVTQFYNQLDSPTRAQSPDLQNLKDTFRALVPNLPPDVTARLDFADSRQQLRQLFDTVLSRGSSVTFDVKTVFAAGGREDDDKNGKDKDDDDDDDNSGELAAGKQFTVWTPFGDCGVEFQTGETYLVYASSDEDSDIAETDICMGTRRLSDAGADLPYLYFHKTTPKESGHLDGFVTSDPAIHAVPPEGTEIGSPVAGVLVELKSDSNGVARYTTSDPGGRFVFDGLAGDTYRLSGYGAEFPDPGKVVAGPNELKIKAKACGRYMMLARPD